VRHVFTSTACEQYFGHTDRELVKRINDLIADVMRNGYEGHGTRLGCQGLLGVRPTR